MLRKSPSGQRDCGVSVPVRLPSSKRHARDDANALSRAHVEQHVLGRLVEDVVDHLHGVDEVGLERLQHVLGLPAVDADAERADLAGAFQILGRPLPPVIAGPAVVPDVELLEIDDVAAQVGEAAIGVCRRCDRRGRPGRPASCPCRATRDPSAAPWSPSAAAARDGAAPGPRAVARCGPRRRSTPCRRSCSRARPPDPARAAEASSSDPVHPPMPHMP